MKKSTLLKLMIFLVINFLGLYLGAFFTSQAVTAEWYLNINKSPVTPPGWFFGFAWTTIMICFSVYMTLAYQSVINKQKLIVIYALQWLLNFLWNPVFFNMHYVGLGLVVIVSLALTVLSMIIMYAKVLKWKSLLLAPYVLWIFVASYLNLYIFLNN